MLDKIEPHYLFYFIFCQTLLFKFWRVFSDQNETA